MITEEFSGSSDFEVNVADKTEAQLINEHTNGAFCNLNEERDVVEEWMLKYRCRRRARRWKAPSDASQRAAALV